MCSTPRGVEGVIQIGLCVHILKAAKRKINTQLESLCLPEVSSKKTESRVSDTTVGVVASSCCVVLVAM